MRDETDESSPLGLRAPGFADIGKYFGEMWKDAETRREELGCELSSVLVCLFLLDLSTHDLGRTA